MGKKKILTDAIGQIRQMADMNRADANDPDEDEKYRYAAGASAFAQECVIDVLTGMLNDPKVR